MEPWRSDKWFVSPFNYEEEIRKLMFLPERVIFHDVTLRDGEQQVGVIFNKHDKMAIARALNRAGVDRIEIGAPGISDEDREAIKMIVTASLEAEIYSWCRNNRLDIEIAKECGSSGVVIETPSSPIMIEKPHSTNLELLKNQISENAQIAKSEGMKVILLLVDATRSSLKILSDIIQSSEKYCDGITISDTFGSILPFSMFHLIRKIKEITKKPIEIHCHNDFGLATANTLAAVAAGASCVHVTVNGFGERAGNAPLGEVALSLKLLMGVNCNIKLEELYKLANIVARYAGIPIPLNKPIVGQNIFKIESSQSAQWLSRGDPLAAYPFLKELIGNPESKVVLSKKSGFYNLKLKLEELKINVPEEKYPEILSLIYRYSLEKKGEVTDDELLDILERLGLYQYKVEDYMRG
ncbi:MAG: hypothetical protein NZ922_03235 [Candidatus Methanomethyliaceae archaeon]|nr:hypothetical protein [Candidatus Methanomethyliaceae archaeon]MDW7970550.1 hypothetical protein [Nitrososphaerota archaeon]